MIFIADQSNFPDAFMGNSHLIAFIKIPNPNAEHAIQNDMHLDINTSTDCWLTGIRVQSDLTGAGSGTKLMRLLEEKCSEEGVRKIVGEFGPDEGKVIDLQRFYEKLGYSLVTNLNGEMIKLGELTGDVLRNLRNPIFIEKTLIPEEL